MYTPTPQGSPLSPVIFLIAIAKVLEDADTQIAREFPSHHVKVYSYVDDFNCTAREKDTPRQRGRKPNSITVARKPRNIVTKELENNGWSRDPDKDEEVNFGVAGEAKWIGITFTHDLNWKTHNNRRLNLAEAAWACISRLGTSRGGLSPTAWRQVYTSSIRAIATYGWELGHTAAAEEKLRKPQYKALRKVTGAYHGARQDTLESIAKIEPVDVKLWDMKVRASARILEKGVQDDLIEETKIHRGNGRSWEDHSMAWAQVPRHRQYNTCLEEILASMGENGERKISWDFDQNTRAPQAITNLELGTKDTLKVVWEL